MRYMYVEEIAKIANWLSIEKSIPPYWVELKNYFFSDKIMFE